MAGWHPIAPGAACAIATRLGIGVILICVRVVGVDVARNL